MSGRDPPRSNSKWTYVPGKKITIAPLNLHDIQRQLESDDSDDDEEAVTQIINQRSLVEGGSPAGGERPVDEDLSEEDEDVFDQPTVKIEYPCDKPSDISFDDATITYPDPDEYQGVSDPNDFIPGIGLRNNGDQKSTNDCDDMRCDEAAITYPYPYDFIPGIGLRNNGDQNSMNDCDNLFDMCSLEPSMEKPGEEVWLKKPPANTTFELTFGDNKENIPSDQNKQKIDDSFDWDLSSLMIPVRKPVEPFGCITPKIIRTIPAPYKNRITRANIGYNKATCTTRSPPRHLESAVRFKSPSVYGPIVYKDSDGSCRIRVNHIEYIVSNLLGRGGNSEVFCGFNLVKKLYVAIKLVSMSGPNTLQIYMNEIKLLLSLQNSNRIVKIHDYQIMDDRLVVVLEKGGKDFNKILKQLAVKQTHMPIYMVLYYWIEMLHAVKEIHSNGIIHCDLKPANFLRHEEGLKLIDFGIAIKVDGDMTFAYKSQQEGTINYVSPEALIRQGDTESSSQAKRKCEIHFKSDVWSLGCILYQIIYDEPPFQKINPLGKKFAAIINPAHKIAYPEAKWACPKPLIETVKKCLKFDVRARPSVDELIQEYDELLMNL